MLEFGQWFADEPFCSIGLPENEHFICNRETVFELETGVFAGVSASALLERARITLPETIAEHGRATQRQRLNPHLARFCFRHIHDGQILEILEDADISRRAGQEGRFSEFFGDGHAKQRLIDAPFIEEIAVQGMTAGFDPDGCWRCPFCCVDRVTAGLDQTQK